MKQKLFKNMRQHVFSIRVEKNNFDKMQALAQKEFRSVNGLINEAILKYLAEKS